MSSHRSEAETAQGRAPTQARTKARSARQWRITPPSAARGPRRLGTPLAPPGHLPRSEGSKRVRHDGPAVNSKDRRGVQRGAVERGRALRAASAKTESPGG